MSSRNYRCHAPGRPTAAERQRGRLAGGGSHGGQQKGSEGGDLKQRESRDEKGEAHHHIKTFMEQHDKK
jgi:hypothetical protein